MSKFQLLSRFFSKANIITDIQTEKNYNFRVSINNSFEFTQETEEGQPEVLKFSAKDIEEAVVQDTLVTLCTASAAGTRVCDFEVKQVTTLTPPVELLSQDDLATLFDQIADTCEGRVYTGYSGRGMFGESCWGVTTNDPNVCIAEARKQGITGERQDSMGRSVIVYWPHIKCTKPTDEEVE